MPDTAPQIDSDPRFSLAAHEAGHAVARFVFNEMTAIPAPPVTSITVRGRGVTMMATRFQDQTPLQLALWELTDSVIPDVMIEIVETFAGPVAEASVRYGEDNIWFTQELLLPRLARRPRKRDGDAKRAQSLLKVAAHLGPVDVACSRRLWQDACQLISREWTGIQKAARVLLERETMTGDEFKSVWQSARHYDPPDFAPEVRRNNMSLIKEISRIKSLYDDLGHDTIMDLIAGWEVSSVQTEV